MEIAKTDKMLGIDLSKRKFGLDILRALAIIFVLMAHSDFSFLPAIMLNVVNAIMLDGVGIFFVLSGYLIGSILIKTIDKKDFNKNELFHFWVNRWFRTLPPYYFILLVIFIVPRFFSYSLEASYLTTELKVRYFLFLQNFIYPHLGFFTESWSLAVEEWFYLLTPIVLFFLYKILKMNTKKGLVLVILIGILLPFLYRLFTYYVTYNQSIDTDIYDYYFRYLVVTRLDGIMYGVLGAYLHYYHKEIWNKLSKTCLVIGLVLICLNQVVPFLYSNDTLSLSDSRSLYVCCISYTVFSLGILFLLPYMTNIDILKKGIMYKSITFVSLISYSLYLLNFSLVLILIMPEIDKIFSLSGFSYLFIYWTISILLSTLMFKYIEKPSMDLRKKVFKK